MMKLYLVKFLLTLWGLLPLSWVHRLGNGIGWLLYHTRIKWRQTISINLTLCFPELSQAERERLTLRSLQEKAKEILEAPAIWTRSRQRLLPLVTHVTGEEFLSDDFAKQQGIILLGAHMGGFYLCNAYLGPKYRGTWLYKPQKGVIEELAKEKRNAYGGNFVPTDKTGVMAVWRALSSGKLVGMSCDHDAGATGGVFAPFFNINAWTMGLPAKLANKSQAPVYFMFLERLAPGAGFHLRVFPVSNAIHQEDAIAATTAMNQTLENCIRQHPEQYDWTYKRFRRRPEGEASVY